MWPMASSSSSSRNWVYDVFPSFSGEDVRRTFLSHFLKELDQKLIISFKDNEIERGQSLDPELKQAIRTSRIAVVVFSEKYPSSSWCLEELLEIVKCKQVSGQLVIPIFYGLDPSQVRKQTGKFGEAFAKTCLRKTEDEANLWRQSLTDVANVLGYHSHNWPNEAKMIEAICNDVLSKLNFASSKEFEGFGGMEDHIAKMSVLLHLESEEVRMVGIWGSSGIGKTTLARVLYSKLSRRFQGSVFIDKAFVYKSKEIYNNANSDDYNMKLHLLRSFLSEILNKNDIRIDRLDSVGERLKHHKVLIFIDDLDDQVVLDTLVGQTQWFGCGSRVIVITKDKHFLRAHGIDHIYEVCLPTKELALEMLCRSAFRQNHPPEGMMELASEVVSLAGNLPLGLNVLGSYLRGRDKEDWINMLPSLRDRLNGKIEKTLRVSYDGLNNRKDEEIFRHIACLFNGAKLNDVKLMLPFSELDINIGLKNLVDKSLVYLRYDIVEMHRLLEDMGKEIVRAQSSEPGEREFLIDSKDICDLLEDGNGTKKVLGISLDMDEINELHIHENAFRGMRNLLFLKIYAKEWDEKKEVRWYLPKGFNYLPHKLRLLRLDGYPMSRMPLNFRPDNLVKLQMRGSNLEKLWEGVHSMRALKDLDLQRSRSLKEVPDLSMATNLEKLELSDCSSLVKLPSSIQYLNKLERLILSGCIKLETLPTRINLQSLCELDLSGCLKLENFPDISTHIRWLDMDGRGIKYFPSDLRLENLKYIRVCNMENAELWGRVQPLSSLMSLRPRSLRRLYLSDIPSLVELPSSIGNFHELDTLEITECVNLETLPAGINFPFLSSLVFSGCSRLKTFPCFSTNIIYLHLERTGIEEVPWWIENFSKLSFINMSGCNDLKRISLNISKLKRLGVVDFSDCYALTEASWNDRVVASFPDNFINRFHFFAPQPHVNKYIMLPGDEAPSYFTHKTTGGDSLTDIPIPPSQPSFTFKVCAVVHTEFSMNPDFYFDIRVSCQFKSGHGTSRNHSFMKKGKGTYLVLFESSFPLNENNAPLAEYVDIRLHLRDCNATFSTSKLKSWGIRDCSSGAELEDSNVETERGKKRIKMV